MEGAIIGGPACWSGWLPPGILRVDTAEALAGQKLKILALAEESRGFRGVMCRVALVPGNGGGDLSGLRAETVVTWGLSPRDSLTLSSLSEPVLCVQRALLRPDGGVVEPQELPLPRLPAPAEQMLPLLGLWLLRMPLTKLVFPW